jgi:hypothetical protein
MIGDGAKNFQEISTRRLAIYTEFLLAFVKNKLVESTDHEAGLPDATSTEVSSHNTNEGLGSKAEKCKFQDVWKSEFLWLIIYDYSNSPSGYLYRILTCILQQVR